METMELHCKKSLEEGGHLEQRLSVGPCVVCRWRRWTYVVRSRWRRAVIWSRGSVLVLVLFVGGDDGTTL